MGSSSLSPPLCNYLLDKGLLSSTLVNRNRAVLNVNVESARVDLLVKNCQICFFEIVHEAVVDSKQEVVIAMQISVNHSGSFISTFL